VRVSELVGPRTIDLNVDIGEGFPYDEELMEFASSANICCGAHAGSEELTRETIALCQKHGLRIGAHPGYPDRDAMGRRPIEKGQERDYFDSLFQQTKRFCGWVKPAYLKPHGAFYNDTALVLPEGWNIDQEDVDAGPTYGAGGIFLSRYAGMGTLGMLLRVNGLDLMGLSQTSHREIASRAKRGLIREGFADRSYQPDGTLVPRSEPGAVLQNAEAIRLQVLDLVPVVDSICLHGDTPDCLEFAELIYKTLTDAGIEVRA
jgi:5-oxoprolinase (ATP-hydrolysing) subunit A